MFRFAHSEYLYALYLLPFIAVLLWYVHRSRKKLLEKFSHTSLLKILAPERSTAKFVLKSVMILLSVSLLILALANPQVGTRYEEVKQTGIDVMICLDVSLSMTAQDIKPSRLEKARHSIAGLIDKLRGDRIGLIVFSGDAYVQFPLTTDYAAANLLLSAVSTNSVPQPGTAIAQAIRTAVGSFKEDSKTQKAVIIITDGEDHEGDVIDAVKDAADKNIRIYAIGLGSASGAPIPVINSQGQQTGYKQDNEGNTVFTKLDDSVLREIAAKGNGSFYRGSSTENELDMIYRDLGKLEKTEFGTTRVTDYEDRFYYLLFPAIILLIAEFFLSEKRSAFWRKINKRLGFE